MRGTVRAALMRSNQHQRNSSPLVMRVASAPPRPRLLALRGGTEAASHPNAALGWQYSILEATRVRFKSPQICLPVDALRLVAKAPG